MFLTRYRRNRRDYGMLASLMLSHPCDFQEFFPSSLDIYLCRQKSCPTSRGVSVVF